MKRSIEGKRRYRDLLPALLALATSLTACDRRADLESQPTASNPVASASDQSASSTTTVTPLAVELKIVSADQFPAVQFPLEKGRWENGDLWVETDGEGGSCWGTEFTQSCPLDDGWLTVDVGIGTMHFFGDPPPIVHRLEAFASSRFVSVRVFEVATGVADERVVCETKAVHFDGRPELAAFECDVSLQEWEQQLTIEFIEADGSTWRLAGELPTVPPMTAP